MTDPGVDVAPYGGPPGQSGARLYTLRNRRGISVGITNAGAAIVSVLVPDRLGRVADVVLGYGDAASYFAGRQYLGAVVGRYANRIANARFSLDGIEYQLTPNDGRHCLHGGSQGFQRAIWRTTSAHARHGTPTLHLRLLSADGEGGFPGTLEVEACYTLDDDNALRLSLTARTDRPTIVSLTGHCYFNLTGDPRRHDISAHELLVPAARYLPVDETLIPTGELRAVDGTPFDFRRATAIGARIDAVDAQLLRVHGYDHTLVTDGAPGQLALRASALEPQSGRTLQLFATEPALQFYSGNYLDGTDIDKHGTPLHRRCGFCLEPQRFPDAPNQQGFPSARLAPSAPYHCVIEYRFGTDAPVVG